MIINWRHKDCTLVPACVKSDSQTRLLTVKIRCMENGNNSFKKNGLTLILLALLSGVCIMCTKDRKEAKEQAESSAVASQESVDSLAGSMEEEGE